MTIQLFLAQQTGASPSGGGMSFMVSMVLIIGIFYLLIYRPMKKRQKNLETMVANLKNGDKVITNGGIHGTVAGIRENTILLKVAEQVKIEVAKSAIASMQAPPESQP